jgi:hypothetical protein
MERRGIPFRVVGRGKAKLEAAFGTMTHAELLDAALLRALLLRACSQ